MAHLFESGFCLRRKCLYFEQISLCFNQFLLDFVFRSMDWWLNLSITCFTVNNVLVGETSLLYIWRLRSQFSIFVNYIQISVSFWLYFAPIFIYQKYWLIYESMKGNKTDSKHKTFVFPSLILTIELRTKSVLFYTFLKCYSNLLLLFATKTTQFCRSLEWL